MKHNKRPIWLHQKLFKRPEEKGKEKKSKYKQKYNKKHTSRNKDLQAYMKDYKGITYSVDQMNINFI